MRPGPSTYAHVYVGACCVQRQPARGLDDDTFGAAIRKERGQTGRTKKCRKRRQNELCVSLVDVFRFGTSFRGTCTFTCRGEIMTFLGQLQRGSNFIKKKVHKVSDLYDYHLKLQILYARNLRAKRNSRAANWQHCGELYFQIVVVPSRISKTCK